MENHSKLNIQRLARRGFGDYKESSKFLGNILYAILDWNNNNVIVVCSHCRPIWELDGAAA